MPEGGSIPGQTALRHLDGWTVEEMAVRAPVAMRLQFPEIRTIPARFTMMMMSAARTPVN